MHPEESKQKSAAAAAALLAGWMLISCSSDTRSPSEATASLSATTGRGRHHAGMDGEAPTLDSNPTLGDFVLYAERSVKLGSGDQVFGGDIGVAALAVQGFGPQLIVGDFSFVDPDGDLLAPSVQLDAGSAVGDVETSSLTNHGGHLGVVASLPPQMPPLPIAAAPATGSASVTVRRFQAERLAPAAYGALTVDGTLLLEPGVFSFSEVTLGDGGQLLALPGGADVRVAGALATGRGAVLSPLEPENVWDNAWGADPHCESQAASQLRVSVFGYDDASGETVALALGPRTATRGLLFAPHGTVSISDDSVAIGALSGFDIQVGDGAVVAYESGFRSSAPGQQGSQTLTGYVLPPASMVIGPVPADTLIPLAIVLPLQDPAGLATFVQRVSDPTSPTYRHYLSVDAFGAAYGAAVNDYQNVTSWAQSYATTVTTYANNLLVDAQAPAAQVESALFVNLVYALRSDGTTFYAPDRIPTFTASSGMLAVDAIHGVDNYAQPQPLGPGSGGTAPGGSFGSSDLRTAYLGAGSSCSTLTGAGQTIGLVAFDGYTGATGSTPGDIETYEATTGLVGVPPVVPVRVGHPPGYPPLPATGGRGSSEAALDIEMAIAMAPGATVIPFQGTDIDSILSAIAQTPSLYQASSSYTGAEATSQRFLDELAAQGISFFVGSGDGGAYAPGLQQCTCACTTSAGTPGTQSLPFCPSTCAASCGPSSTACGSIFDPTDTQALSDLRSLDHLTLVGGTQLTTGIGQAWLSEATWFGSGGGVLTNLPIPAYQQGLPNLASTTYRNSPDVALTATGVYTVATGCNGRLAQELPCPANQTTPNVEGAASGTSASSPLWAGFTALINQAGAMTNGPLGFANPLLYAIGERSPSAFHDIQDGSTNSDACDVGYTAAPGYDLATGWGSPSCALVAQAQVRPTIDVGVADPINAGPVVFLSGTGFTPGGTVTVEYSGIPEQYIEIDAGGDPTTEIAQSNVPVAQDGSIRFLDNEQIPFATATSFAIPACTPQFQATGQVAIQVVDNTTGVSVTTAVPGVLWCEVGPAPFGAACPSVTVTYHQIGACTGSDDGGGAVSVGPYNAYVIFGIDSISSSGPSTFALDPSAIVIQREPVLTPFVMNDPIDEDIFGSRALTETTILPGQSISLVPTGLGAGVVNTLTSNGAVESNETSYFLNYNAASTDPAVNFVKSNATQTSYPFTEDCSTVTLQ